MQTRWASPENPRALVGGGAKIGGSRKGRANVPLAPGETLVLAHEPAGVSGTIRRIWLTMETRTPELLRGLRFDCFWDNAHTPAVSAPLGDFFGHGLGQMTAFENAIFSSPEGRSFCSILPMPFVSGMKITLTNQTLTPIATLFYDISYTVGDTHRPGETAYLHAHFRRENPTTLRRDFTILPRVSGRGQFIGATMSVTPSREKYGRAWWGEGEAKFYLDNDSDDPTLCGTGTEDYIGTAWAQGKFCHAFQGCPIADADGGYCFYRFHIPDPIYFSQNVRVTIQQIGHAFGAGLTALRELSDAQNEIIYAATDTPDLMPANFDAAQSSGLLFERQDDWAACAYFTLDRPENDLPK